MAVHHVHMKPIGTGCPASATSSFRRANLRTTGRVRFYHSCTSDFRDFAKLKIMPVAFGTISLYPPPPARRNRAPPGGGTGRRNGRRARSRENRLSDPFSMPAKSSRLNPETRPRPPSGSSTTPLDGWCGDPAPFGTYPPRPKLEGRMNCIDRRLPTRKDRQKRTRCPSAIPSPGSHPRRFGRWWEPPGTRPRSTAE